MTDADGVGRAINEACSDVVTMYIRVDTDRIVDASFKAQGCVTCIAAASVTTELAQNLSLDEARELGKTEILDVLGEIPAGKIQCSVISPTALHEAVNDFENKRS